MARNRKRAKERRARRPQPVTSARSQPQDAAPSPITHATPDAELAEAQLALGRPDLAEDSSEELEHAPQFGEGPNVPGVFPGRSRVQQGELESDELEEDELETEADDGADGPPSGGAVATAPGGAVPAPRELPGNRLINFLKGSWRELQRVQWPDRRQVMQATGVVIGFVIVAGVFLGVADALAAKLMNFILK